MLKYLIFGSSIAALTAPAFAQDSDSIVIADERIDEAAITVTATGTRTDVEAAGQSVTVIGQEEITSIQGADLTRVLERVPGLTFSRNGGVGSLTGVRLRGAEAEQTLTIIDGVRVADPASPGGGFDFGNLLTGNLEKVEVLRGSNSTIWGSDAVGGVLVASTSAASGLRASAEYGSRDTVDASVAGGVSEDAFFLGGSASWFSTDGFSAAEAGTEADGFEQWAVNGQGRLYLSDRFELFARARRAEGELEIDGFPAPNYTLADTEEYQKTEQTSGSAGAVYDSGPLYVQAAYSFADTARDNFDPATGPTFASDGHSDRIGVRGEWRPIGPIIVHFGGEHEWSEYRTSSDTGADTRIFGAYGQVGIEFGALSAHAGARIDDHARFGSETSFGADISYELAENLRLRGSVGEGFKAPTLYQLFSDYGNEGLQPETSTSFDIGLAFGERTMRDGGFYGAATLFRRDAEDQIEFASCFGSTAPLCAIRPFGYYENIGEVRAQGFELELGASPTDHLTARAVYAYIDTENRTDGVANEGNDLARRPRHALTTSFDWETPLAGLTLGGDLRLVGDSFDDGGNFTRLDGYSVGTLRAEFPVGPSIELFGRVENLWDETYQTVAGYATAGRSGHMGARVRF